MRNALMQPGSSTIHLQVAPSSRRQWLGIVVCVFAVWLTVRAAFFHGFVGSDDMWYSHYALTWDHIPTNHWETRIPYNAIMRAAFLTLGYHDLSVALPGLLGSALLLGSVMYLAWKHTRSRKMLLLAGILAAVEVIDASTASVPTARTLAIGLLAAGMAALLGGRTTWSALAAGLFLAAALATHIFVVFYVGLLLLAPVICRLRTLRHCLLAFAVATGAFLLYNVAYFGFLTGDWLLSFHIASRTHLQGLSADNSFREVDFYFFKRPVREFLFPKEMGLPGGLAALAVVLTWRRRSPLARTLLVWTILSWLWMSYGTQTPSAYLPFPGTTVYWAPLAIALALMLAEVLCAVRRRWLVAAIMAAIIAANLAILGTSIRYQGMDITRELMRYAQDRPTVNFVTDRKTLTQMQTLNTHRPLGNVFMFADSPQKEELPWQATLGIGGAPQRVPFLLFNSLNWDSSCFSQSQKQIRDGLSSPVFQGEQAYLPVTYLLPASIRQAWPWAKRRPPAQVFQSKEGFGY